MTIKISIVTISFNQAQFLRSCIESVLSQDYHNLEYIVVDPGSSDGSREIIESYGDRIIRVFAPDQGAADGLNKGFAVATGDVFGFINSDDVLLPGALSVVAEKFSRKRIDVVLGAGYVIDGNDNRIRAVAASRINSWLFVNGGVTVFQQGTFFSSEIFRQVGGFNIQNTTCWDAELLLDMAVEGGRFTVAANRLAAFRLHSDSISGSGRLTERYLCDRDRLFQKVTGRRRSRLDNILGKFARAGKFLLDPGYLLRRYF